jgi:hypothetical protein
VGLVPISEDVLIARVNDALALVNKKSAAPCVMLTLLGRFVGCAVNLDHQLDLATNEFGDKGVD